MLKTLTSFAILLLCTCWAGTLRAQWVQMASPTTTDLNDVFLLTPDLGWAVGDSGTLLKMTSRVSGFQVQAAVTPLNLVSVAFFDANRGYILPDFGAPYYTSDGGTTWVRDSLLEVCFGQQLGVHANVVYVLAQGCFGGSWVFTKDLTTGDTTNLYRYETAPGGGFTPSVFRAVGFPGMPGIAVLLGDDDSRAYTTDLGDNWTFSGPSDTLPDWQGLCFTPTNIGYAIDRDIYTPLKKSTDGGTTWTVDPSWHTTLFHPYCTDLDWRLEGLGSTTGEISYEDSGVLIDHWPNGIFSVTQTALPMRALDLVTDSLGVAVGDSGTIYYREGNLMAITDPIGALPFSITPNPSTATAHLVWEATGPATLEVFQVDGRLLHQQSLTTGKSSHALPALRPGAYLIRLRTHHGVGTQRWIVQ
jgi:photosystem II stability/assembly factor-like uncharacterized protein